MCNVLIFQKIIKHYRAELFNHLQDDSNGINVFLHYAESEVKTPLSSSMQKVTLKSWRRFYWQKNLFFNLKKTRPDVIVWPATIWDIDLIPMLLYSRIVLGSKVILWGHYKTHSTQLVFSTIKNVLLTLISYRRLFYTQCEHRLFDRLTVGVFHRRILYLNNSLPLNLSVPHSIRNGISSNNNLLFIGRITPKSDFFRLLEAVFVISTTFKKNVHLDVIGNQPKDIKLIHDSCKFFPEINNLVRFHGTVVSEQSISIIARKSMVFVYPGNVGLSLLHAYSLGLPAIVSTPLSAHMPEICYFCEGFNGISFQASKALSLERTILKLFNDVHLTSKLSLGAFNTAKKYNFKKMLINLERAILDCI
jgi:hypothetical protein